MILETNFVRIYSWGEAEELLLLYWWVEVRVKDLFEIIF